MIFSTWLIGAVALNVPLVFATDAVCTNGIYGLLQPLANYPPAQDFCSCKYPAGTVTVNADRKRAATTTTTSTSISTTTTKPTTTTTPKSTTTTTTKSTTTTTTSPSPRTSSTTSTDAKAQLLSSLSSAALSVAQTFCSCIQPKKTVTKTTTTTRATTATTITTTTTTTPAPQPTSCSDAQTTYCANYDMGCSCSLSLDRTNAYCWFSGECQDCSSDADCPAGSRCAHDQDNICGTLTGTYCVDNDAACGSGTPPTRSAKRDLGNVFENARRKARRGAMIGETWRLRRAGRVI